MRIVQTNGKNFLSIVKLKCPHNIHLYLFQSFLRWWVESSPCSTLLFSPANRCSSLAVDTPNMCTGTATSLLEICSCCLRPSSRTRLIRALFCSRTANTLYHEQQEEFRDLQICLHSDLKVYVGQYTKFKFKPLPDTQKYFH